MNQKQLQDEAPEIVINEKRDPIDLDAGKPEPKVETDESNPRAAIYKKHSEQRKAEGGGTVIGAENKPVDNTQDVDPGSDTDNPAKPIPEEEVLVKVNGKEKMVPKSKIEAAGGIEAYRKNAAASELLNQAAAERREIETRKAQLDAQEREIQAARQELQRKQADPVEKTANAEEMKGLARKYSEALLDGDMDTADALLMQMQGSRKVNTEEIAKNAAAEVRAEIRREQEEERQRQRNAEATEASDWFWREHNDIAEDETLRSIANQKTIDLQKANPNWSPKMIVEESALFVRDWMSNKGIGNKLPDDTSKDDKLEAKRQLTVVKGGSARAVPRQAPKAPTSSQYIENMRKMRGLE